MDITSNIILYNLDPLLFRVERVIYNEIVQYSPAFLMIGVLMSFFTDFDFGGTLKRFIQAFIAITLFKIVFTSSAAVGFSVADKILTPKNFVLRDFSFSEKLNFQDEYKENQKRRTYKVDTSRDIWPSVSEVTKGAFIKLFDDPLSALVLIISKLSLWFVKVTFTISYYLPQMLIGIIAFINVLPVTKRSLDGAIISCVWIFLTPIVIVLIMEILNSVLTGNGLEQEIGFMARACLGIIFSLYLIASFTISHAILKGDGLSTAISSTSQSFGAGVVMSATNFLLKNASKHGRAAFFKQGTGSIISGMKESPISKMVVSPTKDFIATKRDGIITKMGTPTEPKSGSSLLMIKPPYQTSIKEKAIIGANAVINPYRTLKSKGGLINSNENSISSEQKAHLNFRGHSESNAYGVKTPSLRSNPSPATLPEFSNKNIFTSTVNKPNNYSSLSADELESLEKSTYVHNQNWWSEIGDDHRNNIKRKYGIDSDKEPIKGVKYYPVEKAENKFNQTSNFININNKVNDDRKQI